MEPNTSVNKGVQSNGGSITVYNSAIGDGAMVNNIVSADHVLRSNLEGLLAGVPSADREYELVRWILQHVSSREEPHDAVAKVGALKQIGSWVWTRLTQIVDAAAPLTAAWLISLVHGSRL